MYLEQPEVCNKEQAIGNWKQKCWKISTPKKKCKRRMSKHCTRKWK